MASGTGGWFGLFGVPFMLVGAWLLVQPTMNRFRAGRTYYAVTDRRILIVQTGKSYKIDTIRADEISAYQREDFPDGTTNIRLRQTLTKNDDSVSQATLFTDGLWGIKEGREAAQAIEDLRDAADKRQLSQND